MCGIAGLVSTLPSRLGPGAEPVLLAMREALRHRGPDDAGLWQDAPADVAERGGCALAFRRLSIIDVEGGHQPLSNEDGSIQIVFNGEVYDHAALAAELRGLGHTFATRTDTEVLVHGWEQWGVGLFERLNGFFDFALWDGRTRQLLLARDRYGKKPLFVGRADGGRTLVFGSELTAVLAHPAIERSVDPVGLQSLFVCDYVASPRSIVRDVLTLEPGTFWLCSVRGSSWDVAVHTWAAPQPPAATLAALSEAAAVDELDARVRAAVERRLVSDVPLGVFLSGGIDSAVVAAYAAELRGPAGIDTFSIGFEDGDFDEAPHARTVAAHLGTRHHERRLAPAASLDLAPSLLARLDQPLADPSILPTTLLCQFAREHVTVALGGDGGDEWFLGYPTYFAHAAGRAVDHLLPTAAQPWLQRAIDRLPTRHGYLALDFKLKRFAAGLGYAGGLRHIAWIGGLEPRRLDMVLHRSVLAELARPTAAPWAPVGDGDTLARLERTWQAVRAIGRDDLDALGDFYGRYYLGDGVLQKVDRASMLNSLEVRAPLLDPQVVALARALPSGSRLRGIQTKRILRKLAARLVPAAIARRPKQGFGPPLAHWLRGPLRPWLEDVLAPARLRRLPWLHADGVRRLVDEHVTLRADHRKPLWALLSFVTWHDRMLGG
ncbi:MAG: asparagine synthase (glutamine-hydrolyzing) [Myxococcales bacterium]|nr:asparagine synthase (glutamine-hydrolyzing) [Myxococcales bacterium]